MSSKQNPHNLSSFCRSIDVDKDYKQAKGIFNDRFEEMACEDFLTWEISQWHPLSRSQIYSPIYQIKSSLPHCSSSMEARWHWDDTQIPPIIQPWLWFPQYQWCVWSFNILKLISILHIKWTINLQSVLLWCMIPKMRFNSKMSLQYIQNPTITN